MNTQTFLNEFGWLADVPNGIQKLRGFILQLAVQGKLTSQLNTDIPAQQLLLNIEAKKTRLFNEDTSTKAKNKLEIKSSEVLFSIPNNWAWEKLGNICSYIQRGISPKYADISEYPVISQKCIRWEGFQFDKVRFITAESAEKYSDERIIKKGDLLWNSTGTGTIGRINVYPGNPNYSKVFADSHVTVLRSIFVLPEYIYIWVASPFIFPKIEGDASGSTKQVELSKSYVVNTVIPLPPIEEQQRIVEKVDQLMALCDQLEAQQQEKKQLRVIMNTASLQALTKAKTQPEIHHSWQRIKDHFGSLYDTPETIPQLRQAILNLGFKGKLVPQKEADEDASILIQKAQKCKEQFISSGRMRKIKPSPDIQTFKKPFELPNGWAWATLDMLAEVIDPNPSHRMPNYVDSGVPFISTENFLENGTINFEKGKKVDSFELEEQIDRFEIRPGSFAVSRIGTIGKTCLLPIQRDYCMSHALCVISTFSEDFCPHYLRLLVSSNLVLNQALKSAKSIGVPDLGVGKIRSFLLPIPPKEEQARIVNKINQLMALCDQLEAQLKQAEADGNLLLQAMIQRLVEGTPASSEATQTSNANTSNLTDAAKQAAVVTYIVSHLRNDASLGDLKVAKILFLIQEHIHIPLGYQYTNPVKAQLQLQAIDSGAEYQKWAAGPFDKALYTETQPEGERKQWFVTEKRTGGGHRYKLAQKAQEGFEMGKAILQPKMAEIDALMKPLAKLQTDDIEIVATLYAAWKELIQKKANRNKDSVLKGFYAWSEKKKQYAPGVVEQWLGWMQDYGITPEPINVLTGATV